MQYLFQHSIFVLRIRYLPQLTGFFRKLIYRLMGMKIGHNTSLPKVFVTWPHKVAVGNHCKFEHHVYFKYDGIWSKGAAIRIQDRVFVGSGCEFNISLGIDIGSDTLISSGCRFIDHDHQTLPGMPINKQSTVGTPIVISDNVWIGCNSVVLKGVEIGSGAVIAAGSVVTKSIPAGEKWAGVPARRIK